MVAVERVFDWAAFAGRYWDRAPVLYKAITAPPFAEAEVFEAASRACEPGRVHSNVQFTVERLRQPAPPGGCLPQASDTSFDVYQDRLVRRLDGRRYALVIAAFHAFHHPQWTRERDFFAGLWENVGLPLTSAITTLFHGDYEHSPAGVHKDRFATFMFALKGRKRMRFWARRPWTQPVSTVLDYDAYLPGSFAVEVEPGDLLYWPSEYFHVGESVGPEPATSVNVGVPREEHRVLYEIEELLTDLDTQLLVDRDGTALTARLPSADAPLLAPGADAGGRLPSVLPPALGLATQALASESLRGRTVELSLRRWTAGGFEPVPPAAARRRLDDDTIVAGDARFPALWADAGPYRVCSANGHAVRTSMRAAELQVVVERLETGEPFRVGDLAAAPGTSDHPDALPGGAEGTRLLLEHLESFHGVRRVTDPRL
ncbi:JmjC domain-containing protein [Sphaerisporangium fuscum]|uniref:JmjC domain-containing protein n=1 Tax=Sphaerisporangium fuscum TaxID=2835868 RepID=UPI001BDD1979|nr:cupin domain-containing protein [Sphaerisporangium fuscum]